MMKEIAWNMFKNTGNIDAFLELKQIENINNEIAYKQNKQSIQSENSTKDIENT